MDTETYQTSLSEFRTHLWDEIQLNVATNLSVDREEFLEMSHAFYKSDAVLHEIDESCHIHAFEEMMKSDLYLMGYILSLIHI